jgi:hypothetical protein
MPVARSGPTTSMRAAFTLLPLDLSGSNRGARRPIAKIDRQMRPASVHVRNNRLIFA